MPRGTRNEVPLRSTDVLSLSGLRTIPHLPRRQPRTFTSLGPVLSRRAVRFRVPQRHALRVSIAVGALRGARSRACLTRLCSSWVSCYARSQLIWRGLRHRSWMVGVGRWVRRSWPGVRRQRCASAGIGCAWRAGWSDCSWAQAPGPGARRSGAGSTWCAR
jgi:hypothetical protein